MAELAATLFATATSSPAAMLSTGGTILSTAGAIQQGKSAKSVANYQAKLAEKRADEERAAGILKSKQHRRAGKLAISRARAVGAASGGGLDFDLMGDLAEESERRALNAIWVGETGADNAEAQGAEALFEGRNKNKASMFKAGGTLLRGGTSLMDKYG